MKITNQQLTLIIALASTIALGVSYTSGAIKDYRIIMLGFMALFLSIMAQPIFMFALSKIAGKMFGKGINDYWAEILKEKEDLRKKAWEEFEKARASAWEEYEKAEAPVWEEYQRTIDSALKKFLNAKAPTLEEYKKTLAEIEKKREG